jgi:LPS-assembly protein
MLLICTAQPALADFSSCPAPSQLMPDLGAIDQRALADAEVNVNADHARYDVKAQTYTFTGDVLLERAGQILEADFLRYHESSNRVDVDGNVRMRQGEASLTASDGYLYLDEDRGELNHVDFMLGPSAHGSAREARLRNASDSEYSLARYTTCPPSSEDWWLKSRDLKIDRDEGFATARHATLSFYGLPILYTPYISFPIDDRRKTGVLPPTIGYRSEAGLDLAIPYYLNLAPNYDMTLTPRLITGRGLMLDTEARLLRPGFATELGVDYLPSDSLYGDDRWRTELDFRSLWQNNAYLQAQYNRVSDTDYLNDFGSDLSTVSEQDLLSQFVMGYRTNGWHLQALAQSWQSLDDTLPDYARPYRILPRVIADYRRPADEGDLSYGLTADVARFAYPNDLRVTGVRSDLLARTSLRHERQAYYLIPGVALSHTRYQLNQPDPTAPESLDRSLPLFSVDSGVFLERDTRLAGHDLLQTLEPRLFYLYVPYRDQSALPLFDTSKAELTLAQLFDTNRFTGPDRIGDANQVAASITSRLLHQASGRELLSAGIGRAFYFQGREVTIGPQLPEDRRSVSDLLANARTTLGAFALSGDLRYDTHDREIVRRALRLSYRPAEWKAINLEYRQRDEKIGDPLEQTELSAVWPISDRWLALGGWHYSLRDRLTLERFAGIAYNSCCWTARTVLRQHVTSIDDDPSLSIMFQLEFIGLGALGQRLDTFIEEAISGYRFDR